MWSLLTGFISRLYIFSQSVSLTLPVTHLPMKETTETFQTNTLTHLLCSSSVILTNTEAIFVLPVRGGTSLGLPVCSLVEIWPVVDFVFDGMLQCRFEQLLNRCEFRGTFTCSLRNSSESLRNMMLLSVIWLMSTVLSVMETRDYCWYAKKAGTADTVVVMWYKVGLHSTLNLKHVYCTLWKQLETNQ